MAADLLLGIDVGTSATKAVLCNSRASVIAKASASHPTSRPRAGWSEQNPEDWWQSAVSAVRQVLADPAANGGSVVGVGLSGQMHGAVFLAADALQGDGSSADALRPAILWNDQRTSAEVEEIEARAGGRRAVVDMVGNGALTGFTLPKILWLRRHEPNTFAKARAVILPKDYLRLRITGRCATDVGDGSGTLLLNIETRQWSLPMLRAMDLDPALLPPIHESAAVAGSVSPWAAEQLGLRAGIPVVAGSGDSQAGGIGAGVVVPGIALAAMGTSGVIYAHAESPLKDLRSCGPANLPGCIQTKCSATGTASSSGAWCITGCVLSAGGSLEFARNLLMPGAPFEAVIAEAQEAPPGAGGLIFLPYLTGERCPYPDPSARGAWIGLTSRHTRAHLIRAVIEGITFGMAQVLALVRGLDVPIEKIRLGGGGNRSRFWRQLQADLYRLPVATTNTEEGPAFGAALLAAVGAGVFPDAKSACTAAISETEVLEPSDSEREAYSEAMAIYQELYPRLQSDFPRLAALDTSA